MEIANLQIIEKFKRTHAGSRRPLDDWITRTEIAKWKTPNDIKKLFSSASLVKDFVIFNIGGNKYRLLTEVFYQTERVRILRAGTHEDYNGWTS